ncbi:MAG: hypothetical protein F6K21_00440 [Symploca sp. SIO2D2]|nr:hypothetical protein [Symploca sp. SIO2D2]
MSTENLLWLLIALLIAVLAIYSLVQLIEYIMSQQITKVSIYPPIGIARVGNAPDDYYFAPEIPGQPAQVEGGYKDSQGRLKKQVVRFRIYGLNDQDEVIKELTADDATITWRVHVANRKAAWYQFNNAMDLGELALPAQFRNASILDENRQKLIIDPGSKSISGRNVSGSEYHLNGGKFFDKEVALGEIRTDDKGRLLFFGGDGKSASKDGKEAITFANNDGWHDDVSDGPIRAKVLYNGKELEAEPAMVAVTPPNFGQGLYGMVTMYDVVLDLFIREGWVNRPSQLNFWQHIYPIFERMTQTQWVNSGFFFLFGKNSPSDLTEPELVAQLSNPAEAAKPTRRKLLEWFRNPDYQQYQPAEIPPFYGDGFGEYEGLYKSLPQVDLVVTKTQYQWLEQWAEGNFISDPVDVCQSFDDMSPAQQVEALTIAPLEECLGGPFHPGIEITWPLRNLITWEKPFRLKVLPEGQQPKDDFGYFLDPNTALGVGGPLDGSGPGTLTRWLGVPWQTDEASCLSGYDPSTYLPLPSFWAARVPNQVLSEDSFKRLTDPNLNIAQRLKHFDYRQNWLRDLGDQYQSRINKMIEKWHQLGIIAKHPVPEAKEEAYLPNTLWVESDRGPFAQSDPSFEQVLRAENAEELDIATAQAMLDRVAQPNLEERPKQERPLFKRDER